MCHAEESEVVCSGTSSIADENAIAGVAGGGGAPSQVDPDAGRWRVVDSDRASARLQSRLYRALEASFRAGAAGRFVCSASRTRGECAHPSDGSADLGTDAQEANGWLDSLDNTETGQDSWG